MANVYDSLRKATEHKISRREFLKIAATAGLASPAVMAFLEGCTPKPAAAPTAVAANLSTFTQADAQAKPLIFNAWAYMPEVVADFQKVFEQQYGESVHFEVIPGDYTSIMINKLIANSPLDCVYTQSEGVKMLEAGWLLDLNELDNIQEIKAATLPAQWEAQTYKGKVFGLPYFNSQKCVLGYNRIKTQKAGLKEADLPGTWDEAYALARQFKKDGLSQYPLVTWWNPRVDILVAAFQAECIDRGDLLWDEQLNATFDENTPIADTLNAWQGLWKDQLVSPDLLTSAEPLETFGTGDAVFSVIQSYELQAINDPSKYPIGGNVMMAPYKRQTWGVLDYGLYSIAARPQEDKLAIERRKRWVEFMGYKDKDGKFLVAKEWVKRSNLGSGYPAVYDDPEVIAAWQTWMPEYPRLKDILKENEPHVSVARGWHAVYYPEWAVKAIEVVPKVITGDMKVSDGVRALRDEWDMLQKRYQS